MFTFARHSWPLSSESSFACHTYYDTGHPFIMVCWAIKNGAVTTCFYNLGLLRLGFKHRIFLSPAGESCRPLRHRRGFLVFWIVSDNKHKVRQLYLWRTSFLPEKRKNYKRTMIMQIKKKLYCASHNDILMILLSFIHIESSSPRAARFRRLLGPYCPWAGWGWGLFVSSPLTREPFFTSLEDQPNLLRSNERYWETILTQIPMRKY